jgi:hypothetical protein
MVEFGGHSTPSASSTYNTNPQRQDAPVGQGAMPLQNGLDITLDRIVSLNFQNLLGWLWVNYFGSTLPEPPLGLKESWMLSWYNILMEDVRSSFVVRTRSSPASIWCPHSAGRLFLVRRKLPLFGPNCSLPFSLRSLDIPALFEILAETLQSYEKFLRKRACFPS